MSAGDDFDPLVLLISAEMGFCLPWGYQGPVEGRSNSRLLGESLLLTYKAPALRRTIEISCLQPRGECDGMLLAFVSRDDGFGFSVEDWLKLHPDLPALPSAVRETTEASIAAAVTLFCGRLRALPGCTGRGGARPQLGQRPDRLARLPMTFDILAPRSSTRSNCRPCRPTRTS